MGQRMKNFNIFGFTEKSEFLGVGEFLKTQYIKGDCPRKGGLEQFSDLRGGGLARKMGG